MKPFQGNEVKTRVDKLMEAIKPKTGDVYLHQDIAHAGDCEYPSHRYRSVITSWRKRLMRDLNVDIGAVVGIGYRVLDDNERVSFGIKNFSESVRAMGKSVNRIERADTKRLDDHHRRQQEHTKRLRDLVDSGRGAQKQIAVAGKVVALPRKAA